MADTYISRAATGNVTSDKTWTFSFWLKRGDLNRTQTIFMHENAASHNEKFQLELQSDNTFRVSVYDGSTEFNYDTNMLFRDTSGWYNVVVRWDTTQSTSTDRVRIYVNGSQITFDNANGSTATMPNQNFALDLGEKIMVWGRYQASSPGAYFNGSLSYCQYADGQSYAPTTFGSIDSVTGQWKINTNATVTYGDNGFFILKNGNRVINDAGNSSGNFAVSGGTLTNTEDCPDNVFATMNPLDNYYPNFNLAYGNTSVGAGNGPRTYLLATMGLAPTGKYYWEIKLQGQSNGASSNSVLFGISQKSTDSTSEDLTDGVASSTVIDGSGRVYVEGSLAGTFGSSYEPSTVMCLAYDAVNNKMYFGKDGTWLNSGNPTSGSTGTGAFTPTATNGAYNNIYIPCWGVNYNSGYSVAFNFGNGSFNTSAVSSAGTNASSNGIFEHDVPTGYTALSTKGLNL